MGSQDPHILPCIHPPLVPAGCRCVVGEYGGARPDANRAHRRSQPHPRPRARRLPRAARREPGAGGAARGPPSHWRDLQDDPGGADRRQSNPAGWEARNREDRDRDGFSAGKVACFFVVFFLTKNISNPSLPQIRVHGRLATNL